MSEKKRIAIPRDYIVIELRGEEHKVFSLPAADLKLLPATIERLLANLFLQASRLAQADWGVKAKPKRKGLPVEIGAPPQATIDMLRGLFDGIINDPLALLEVVSGLPHKFFDTADRENCLSLAELKAVADVVIEVNGLDFLLKKLKGWWKQIQEASAQRRQSAVSAHTSALGLIQKGSNTSSESTPMTSFPGWLGRLLGKSKKEPTLPRN
jgi:hypothetical protein